MKTKKQPSALNWATTILGRYNLNELILGERVTESRFWDEARQWAKTIARWTMTDRCRQDYWTDEFAAVAVDSLYVAWSRHPHLKGEPWFKFAKTVFVRQIQRAFLSEMTQGKVTFSMDVLDCNDGAGRTVSPIEVHLVNGTNDAERLERIEEEHDLAQEFIEFFRRLSPCERRVLRERVLNPSAISDEIAGWAEFRTGSAVRFHEKNLRRKARQFVEAHPHKKEWQRCLQNEGHADTAQLVSNSGGV